MKCKGELAIEDGHPFGAVGFDDDVLHELGVLVAATRGGCRGSRGLLGLAEMDPVGGAVAGAAEARCLTECLQQDGADAVEFVPVARQLVLEAGEQMGGQ